MNWSIRLKAMKQIKLVIDNNILDEYDKFYFKAYPRRKKRPIPYPYHESINKWMIMKRPMMNALKQRWKEFICWFIRHEGYEDAKIDNCTMDFITYYRINRRHDVDNSVPKFILDGFAESGFIVDDDYKHLTKLSLACGIDKDNPRTEIIVNINE